MTKSADLQEYWLRQLKKGDETAAAEIYRQHATPLYNTLLRLVGEQQEAQDLLQEVFITAFRKVGDYRGEAPFGAWIRKIAVNAGLDHLRRRKVWFETIEEHHVPVEEESSGWDFTAAQVHAAIKELPTGSRAVLTLFLLEGYSHKEVAEKLGISVSTSKTQYLRAKALVRKRMTDTAYENR